MSAEGRWLRLNINWDDSEWIFALSAESQLCWIKLLCHAKRDGDRYGSVKALSMVVAAKKFGIGVESVEKLIHAAKTHGAITEQDGVWTITKWLDHQGSDSTERVRRFREKQAVTPCNVTSGYETLPCHATETETETYITPLPPTGEIDRLSPEVRDVWEREWIPYRKENRLKPYKPLGLKATITELLAMPDPIGAMRHSMAKGYQGIFPNGQTKPKPKARPGFTGVMDAR